MKRLLDPELTYDLSAFKNPTTTVTRPSGRCPFCDGRGVWRRGVHFDHQMRCGKCDVVWTPDEDVVVMTADD